jgi:gamma-glutamylcyclotransferase (GGCT)/AIG2-like uncharacterized protein YtfP
MNLFVYGTLMVREQIESLIGRKLGNPVVARIHGFTKIMSSWGYPVIIPQSDANVEGIVWRELIDANLIALDRYEGCGKESAVYQREKRTVIVNGREEEAWVYVATSGYLRRLT